MKKNSLRGFSLIEVMVVVVIVGILASIAYPSYIDFVTKSGRSEGVVAVMKVANLQEQYYLDNRTYTSDMTELGLATPFITEHGYYSVASVGTSSSFTITATAKGSQASRDPICTIITITSAGVKGPAAECWK